MRGHRPLSEPHHRLLIIRPPGATVSDSATYHVSAQRLDFSCRQMEMQIGHDFVDANDVALLLGLRHRNSVSTYLRRYSDFPAPIIDRGPRRARIWRRGDIIAWMAAHPRRPRSGFSENDRT